MKGFSRGERHISAKLTAENVREIRLFYATGEPTQKELAPVFGVTPPTIHSVVHRKTWTHVA